MYELAALQAGVCSTRKLTTMASLVISLHPILRMYTYVCMYMPIARK